jgi:hypothetical protein
MTLRVLMMGADAEEQPGTDALATPQSGIRSWPMGSGWGPLLEHTGLMGAEPARCGRWVGSEPSGVEHLLRQAFEVYI